MTGQTHATLRSILDAFPLGRVRVVAAPEGLDVLVRSVHIYEADTPVVPGDVLLVPTFASDLREVRDSVEVASRSRAAALIVRSSAAGSTDILPVLESGGCAVLAVDDQIQWPDVWRLVDTAQDVEGLEAPVQGLAEVPVGDLFGLANAVAKALDGATAISDRDRVVAYSDLPIHALDDVRQTCILSRRLPSDPSYASVYAQVLRAREPMWTCLPGQFPRIAVGVTVAGEPMGSIWVLRPDGRVAPGDEDILAAAGRIAALHLMRLHTAQESSTLQTQGEALRGILCGNLEFAESLECVWQRTAPVMLRFKPVLDTCEVDVDTLHRALTAACLSAGVTMPIVAGLDGCAYLLTTSSAGNRLCGSEPRHRGRTRSSSESHQSKAVAEAIRLGERLCPLIESLTGHNLVVSVSSPIGRPGDVASARTEVDMVGDVELRESGNKRIRSLDDVQDQVLISGATAGLKRRLGFDRSRGVQLLEHDRMNKTMYAATVLSYLREAGNVDVVGRTMCVHPNTIRYRIKRAEEIIDADLRDPVKRLAVWLTLEALSSELSDIGRNALEPAEVSESAGA